MDGGIPSPLPRLAVALARDAPLSDDTAVAKMRHPAAEEYEIKMYTASGRSMLGNQQRYFCQETFSI